MMRKSTLGARTWSGLVAAMSAAGLLTLAAGAQAQSANLPQGEIVRAGATVAISGVGKTLTIQHNEKFARVDWDTFSIGADHTVQIYQARDAVIVNRVTGSLESKIDGALNSDGTVYLVNPNGVTFGGGARVNVGGLLVSGLSIDDRDGKSLTKVPTKFVGPGNGVRNDGHIKVRDGGVATFIGRLVLNDGRLEAPGARLEFVAAKDAVGSKEDGWWSASGRDVDSGLIEFRGHEVRGREIRAVAANGVSNKVTLATEPAGRIALLAEDGDVDAFAPIQSPGGMVRIKAKDSVRLSTIEAEQLEIDGPVSASFQALDKNFDGTNIALIGDSPEFQGLLPLLSSSNLKLATRFHFEDAQVGEGKRVTGTLVVTGFNGDKEALIPIRGESRAAIREARLPAGFTTRWGEVAFNDDDPYRLVVTQRSPVAKIDWQSFNIARHHEMRIVQPDAAAFMVHRVTGTTASQIDGRLSANGRVFIVNPRGITFGGGAQLNAAGLVASTLGVTDEAMTSMAPVLELSGPSAPLVQNGAIRVKEGGVLTLVSGKEMDQVGTLSAPSGAIHLAAAERVVLDASGRLEDVSGAFQRLGHPGISSASNGEVSIVAGGDHSRPLEVGGTVEASGSGRIALRSAGPFLHLSGVLRPGKSLLIDEGIAYISEESDRGHLASSVLETWLNDGVAVEFRRPVYESFYFSSDITAKPTATGKLTVRGGVEVYPNAAIHMGAGHLEFLDGAVWQHAHISAPGGSVTIAGTRATLHQIHAGRLTIRTPVDIQFRARDKVQDGTRTAQVDDVKISGVELRKESNLRMVQSFEFDSPEEGLRYVAPSLEITGFNGDAKASIPV